MPVDVDFAPARLVWSCLLINLLGVVGGQGADLIWCDI